MAGHVYANGRSIVHAGDGLMMVAATPDVCKTPTPGGPPAPVPYPNIARTADLAGGTRKVTICGKSVAIEGAKLRLSTGDEAGSVGGVFSGKIKGAMSWGSCSPNVRFEGKGVIRFFEPTLHNGNGSNDDGLSAGANYLVAPDDKQTECLHCGLPWEKHEFPEITADADPYIEAQGKYCKSDAHLIGGLQVSDRKGGVRIFVDRAGGQGGILDAGSIFNFATGQRIEVPDRLSAMRRQANVNPVGNCVEQRTLHRAWLDFDRKFPFDRALRLGVGRQVDPHNGNWNKPQWTAKKFKKGQQFARPCLTCREIMMAMLCRNPPRKK
jgi:hypothetical protein